jgi:hypothetical protein
MCIVTVGRLRMGIPVTVELYVPDGGSRFKSRAIVAWSTTVESRGRVAHAAGLRLERPLMPEPRRKPEPAPPAAPPSPPSPPAPASSRAPNRSASSKPPEPQRAHRRFSPEEVELLCYPAGFLRAVGLANNAGRRLKDLSRAGAQIVCSRKLLPGERVHLRLEFKKKPWTIQAEGEVRWCRRDTASLEPRYYAGVMFDRLPAGAERSLREIERAFIGY